MDYENMTDRELDVAVAEKVMGFEIVESPLKHEPRYYLPDYERRYHRSVPNYSTDISDAWEVAEKMCEREDIKFGIDKDYTIEGKYVAGFHYENGYAGEISITAPRAICIAALKAVER